MNENRKEKIAEAIYEIGEDKETMAYLETADKVLHQFITLIKEKSEEIEKSVERNPIENKKDWYMSNMGVKW
jgi:hypothetical protein